MKILLTGAGGQIGHDLIGALVAGGHEVVSTDLAPRPPSHAHAGGESWQRLDVTDAAATVALFMELKPDLVFHLAAILSARGEQRAGRAGRGRRRRRPAGGRAAERRSWWAWEGSICEALHC